MDDVNYRISRMQHTTRLGWREGVKKKHGCSLGSDTIIPPYKALKGSGQEERPHHGKLGLMVKCFQPDDENE